MITKTMFTFLLGFAVGCSLISLFDLFGWLDSPVFGWLETIGYTIAVFLLGVIGGRGEKTDE